MKTAIEWLVQELFNNGYFHYGIPEDLIQPAKAMEKENICDAFEKGRGYPYETGINHAEQYYNKTFKSETIVTEFKDGTIKVETFKSE